MTDAPLPEAPRWPADLLLVVSAAKFSADKLDAALAFRDESGHRVVWSAEEVEPGLAAALNSMDDTRVAYAELLAEVEPLIEALIAARTELTKWGWGDMHYGSNMPQERRVVDAIAAVDAALARVRGPEGRVSE